MLRKDGIFKFFKIQHQWRVGGDWNFSTYGEYAETNSRKDTFTASGKCWQETGEHGVYNIRNAKAGLKYTRKKALEDFKKGKLSRKLKFRIVRVEITQKTTLVIV